MKALITSDCHGCVSITLLLNNRKKHIPDQTFRSLFNLPLIGRNVEPFASLFDHEKVIF